MSRYIGRKRRKNRPKSGEGSSIYQEFVDKRNVRQIVQYTSPSFPQLTVERRRSVEYENHVWKMGDRFYKLAYDYYGDASLWYLIAWYNETPTENHVNLGDTIMIPLSAEKVLTYFNR